MRPDSTGRDALLCQRYALHPPPAHAGGLEPELERRKLGAAGEPTSRGSMDTAHLLLVDHLERIAVGRAALLLHLDEATFVRRPLGARFTRRRSRKRYRR